MYGNYANKQNELCNFSYCTAWSAALYANGYGAFVERMGMLALL